MSELNDTVNELEKKHEMNHWAFPDEINPADFPELFELEQMMLIHVEHYKNDFYIHDIYAYLKGDKKAIWFSIDTY